MGWAPDSKTQTIEDMPACKSPPLGAARRLYRMNVVRLPRTLAALSQLVPFINSSGLDNNRLQLAQHSGLPYS